MPTDGEHLLIAELQTGEEEHDDGFFAVSHRETAEIDIVGVVFFPRRVGGIAAALHDRLVDFGLVHIVEQGAEDDTVFAQYALQVRPPAVHHFHQFEGGVAHVERMLHQSTGRAEVKARRGRRFEKPQVFEVFNDIFHALAFGGAKQLAKLSLMIGAEIRGQIS